MKEQKENGAYHICADRINIGDFNYCHVGFTSFSCTDNRSVRK